MKGTTAGLTCFLLAFFLLLQLLTQCQAQTHFSLKDRFRWKPGKRASAGLRLPSTWNLILKELEDEMRAREIIKNLPVEDNSLTSAENNLIDTY